MTPDTTALTHEHAATLAGVVATRQQVRGLAPALDAELEGLHADVVAACLALQSGLARYRLLLRGLLAALEEVQAAVAPGPAEAPQPPAAEADPLSSCLHSSPACPACASAEALALARQLVDPDIAEQIEQATRRRDVLAAVAEDR